MKSTTGHLSEAMLQQLSLAGLPESEVRPVMQHLAECTGCQCRLETLQFWGQLEDTVFGNKGCVSRS